MGSNGARRLLAESNVALIMGVVNVTPDSFSDGGRFDKLDKALDHALGLVEQGADILDIGGESTRPGAERVGLEQELERVVPLIEALTQRIDTPISIDTYKPEIEAVVKASVPVCIMHMQGDPSSMQIKPSYANVVDEVLDFFQQRIDLLVGSGL